jgi:hypothetical protein
MAQPKRQEGPLTAAALATYGIPPKPPEGPKLVKVKEQATEAKVHERKRHIEGGGRKVDERLESGSLRESGKESLQSSRVDWPR